MKSDDDAKVDFPASPDDDTVSGVESPEVVSDLAPTEPLAPPPAPTPDPATLYALGAMVDALRFTIAEAIGRGAHPTHRKEEE